MALREQEIRPSASVVVVFRKEKEEDEILLVRHGPKAPRKEGVYGFPGGKPKIGESPEEAAVREFKEETGLEIALDNLIPFSGTDNVYSGVHKRETGNKNYEIRAFTVKDTDFLSGSLKKTNETIPVWAKVKTLKRRRTQLMGSVEQIVFEGLQLVNND